MGCAQTRNKSAEQEIQVSESYLPFSRFSIPQINQAFFHTNGSNTINNAQLLRALEELEFTLTVEDEDHYKRFISAFVSFEEDGEDYYDLTEMLIATYLVSKSSQREKACALFDLYNDEAKDELLRIEIEGIINKILDVVFSYSEKLMDNDEGLTQLHSRIVHTKKEELLPKVYECFFSEKENLTREQFSKLVENTARQDDLINLTHPSSIRKSLMNFLSSPKKTQVELQNHQEFARLKRTELVFEDDTDVLTRSSTSLQASPTITVKKTQSLC